MRHVLHGAMLHAELRPSDRGRALRGVDSCVVAQLTAQLPNVCVCDVAAGPAKELPHLKHSQLLATEGVWTCRGCLYGGGSRQLGPGDMAVQAKVRRKVAQGDDGAE